MRGEGRGDDMTTKTPNQTQTREAKVHVWGTLPSDTSTDDCSLAYGIRQDQYIAC